jgi:hypothetical protein
LQSSLSAGGLSSDIGVGARHAFVARGKAVAARTGVQRDNKKRPERSTPGLFTLRLPVVRHPIPFGPSLPCEKTVSPKTAVPGKSSLTPDSVRYVANATGKRETDKNEPEIAASTINKKY